MSPRPLLSLLALPLLFSCADTAGRSMGKTRAVPPAAIIGTSLVGSAGQIVGTATLVQEAEGTRITVTVTGVPIGTHAVHLHAIGRCEGPAFISAGGHFNPEMKQHGHLNPMGDHAGDLPNLVVGDDHRGTLDFLRPGLRLVDGAAPLLDADGAALMVHAGPDDFASDPAGNAGGRIACGVIARTPATP
jgi:superoxide dismutase, Cu-Zn family